MNIQPLLAISFGEAVAYLAMGVVVIVLVGVGFAILTCYRKVTQGQALVKNGVGGTDVTFSGRIVYPIIHRAEYMDISVKRVEIDRAGKNGLICMDNLRA